MSAREELVTLLAERYHAAIPRPTILDGAVADAILAAGYSKPRTITTAEELDALPVESIVMERGNAKFCLASPAIWLCFDPNEPYTSADIALPATVLYTPKES